MVFVVVALSKYIITGFASLIEMHQTWQHGKSEGFFR